MAQAAVVPTIDLDYAFTLRLDTGERITLDGAMRSRVFEPVVGGSVSGPRLNGKVVPRSGADFASNTLMDAHLMLQANDGTWLYMNLFGYEHAEAGSDKPYFRVAPYFDTPAGTHEWLSKTVFIGTGERHADHLLIHVYALK